MTGQVFDRKMTNILISNFDYSFTHNYSWLSSLCIPNGPINQDRLLHILDIMRSQHIAQFIAPRAKASTQTGGSKALSNR